MDDDYAEAVLDLVAQIPEGRAMTYGLIAEIVGDGFEATGGKRRGGPRQVGQVLARTGRDVPWWRVVNTVGRPPLQHLQAALDELRHERTPLVADGSRVALRTAIWFPDD